MDAPARLAVAARLVAETAAALDLDDPQLISYDRVRQYWLDRLARDLDVLFFRKALAWLDRGGILCWQLP